VTGASTGLGLVTATALAEAGHQVAMHVRSRARVDGLAVVDAMHAVITGDLANQDETAAVAEQANRIGRFDAVIHNAGVMDVPEVLAVNAVAPYLLTALTESPRRWIILSSSLHRKGSADLAGVDFTLPCDRPNAYEDSKLYATALTMALVARRPDLLAHAVDPGWMPTRMGGPNAGGDLADGSRTQEWLAVADEGEISPRSGGYWRHRATRPPHPAALDPAFQDELLAKLEAATGVSLA